MSNSHSSIPVSVSPTHASDEHFINHALLEHERDTVPFTPAEVERFAALSDDSGEHASTEIAHGHT